PAAADASGRQVWLAPGAVPDGQDFDAPRRFADPVEDAVVPANDLAGQPATVARVDRPDERKRRQDFDVAEDRGPEALGAGRALAGEVSGDGFQVVQGRLGTD